MEQCALSSRLARQAVELAKAQNLPGGVFAFAFLDGSWECDNPLLLDHQPLNRSTRAGAFLARMLARPAHAWVVVSVWSNSVRTPHSGSALEAAERIAAAARLVDVPLGAVCLSTQRWGHVLVPRDADNTGAVSLTEWLARLNGPTTASVARSRTTVYDMTVTVTLTKRVRVEVEGEGDHLEAARREAKKVALTMGTVIDTTVEVDRNGHDCIEVRDE